MTKREKEEEKKGLAQREEKGAARAPAVEEKKAMVAAEKQERDCSVMGPNKELPMKLSIASIASFIVLSDQVDTIGHTKLLKF